MKLEKSTKALMFGFFAAQAALIVMSIIWPKDLPLLWALTPSIVVFGFAVVICIWLSFVTGFWEWILGKK